MATIASPIPCALLYMTLSLLHQESPSTECGLSDLLRANRMQQKGCCVTSEPFSFCLFSWNTSLWMLPVGKLLSTRMPWFEESKPHGEAMVCQYSGLQPQMSILIILVQAPAMWTLPHDSNPSHLSHPPPFFLAKAPDIEEQRQAIPTVPYPNASCSESMSTKFTVLHSNR